jgi:methyl-accepting chemotaxis protein/methyl-accepting chemotaxis protein-1 (serine sensor receptor)
MVWRHIANHDPADRQKQESGMLEAGKTIREQAREYEKSISSEEDRRIFKPLMPAMESYFREWESGVLPLSQAGRTDAAIRRYLTDMFPKFNAASGIVADLQKYNEKSSTSGGENAQEAGKSAMFWSWTILLASVAIGSLLAIQLLRGIGGALRQAVDELSAGAEHVAIAASQVAASSQSVAQGASRQASSLEESSAAGEEISSMAHRNTENSRTAAELVASSQRKFTETNQALEQMVGAMGEIESSSGRIATIIKTIDEIAFQTNILALNAAVEAARAGQAGLGFAVVADEVRNLAQRCAQAAKDTAGMIEESIARSGEGKAKVNEVAEAIRTVTQEAARVTTLVGEVNLGSQEQAQGIEQMAKAIAQVERVTQQTAASAEESAAAAAELTTQSGILRDIVGRLTAMVGHH